MLFSDDRSYDAPTFGLASLPDIDLAAGTVTLEIKQGTYFDFIDTCLCFGYELTAAVVSAKARCRLRERFALSDVSQRHAQIGSVTLVVINNVLTNGGRSPYMLLHRRSGNVTESANLINAVPGATFQPAYDDLPRSEENQGQIDESVLELALIDTVVREFCEEVGSVQEFSELTSGTAVRCRPEWPVFSEHTYFMGLGINPLNPYVEILSLAVLDVSRQADNALFGGDTYDAVEGSIKANEEGAIDLLPFSLDTLKHYHHQYRSAPALKQLCRILIDGGDDGRLQALLPGLARTDV